MSSFEIPLPPEVASEATDEPLTELFPYGSNEDIQAMWREIDSDSEPI